MLNNQPMQAGHIQKRQAIQKDGIDLASNTNEVQDPKLIFNSLFFTNQAFDGQVQIYNRLSIGFIIVHIFFFLLAVSLITVIMTNNLSCTLSPNLFENSYAHECPSIMTPIVRKAFSIAISYSYFSVSVYFTVLFKNCSMLVSKEKVQ